jgi:hypothetical protein
MGSPIVLGQSAVVSVQHWQGTAIFTNALWLSAPESRLLVPAALPHPGSTVVVGSFSAGTELVFKLANLYPSTGVQAQVADYGTGRDWLIGWEDQPGGDDDYDDAFTFITAVPIAPRGIHVGPIVLNPQPPPD